MPMTAKKKPKVGDKASVKLGGTVWRVRIIEDRGLLGVGGRRIFRVKPVSKDSDPEQTFEVPEEYITAVR
jgi:hypothetical protein